MRDRDVREALHRKVLKEHHDHPDTLVLNELGLRYGTCRVDIAVVNGFLHGFEIKSDSDTLERLPTQIVFYGAVLDRATLVVGEKHYDKAAALLPEWWGIKVAAVGARGAVTFANARPFGHNRDIDPVALAELLWRPEVIDILRARGAPARLLREPRAALHRHLADALPLNDLRVAVRQQLKARERWRGHRPLSSDGGLWRPIPR